MRRSLALSGLAVFAAIALLTVSTRALAPADGLAAAGAAPYARAAAAPYATADPADRSRVEPAAAHGRLAPDERVDRRRLALHGLRVPIEGARLPTDADVLPNAPREFRAGWHEGIDFPAAPGTAVHAVADGTIVRVDRDFMDWDPELRDIALYEAVQLGYTPAATLDRIRGRQVWIDHGHGIVSRYAHLSAVADVAVGDAIIAGQVIGEIGSSGYPEGGPHLHLELRVSSSYLGDGLSGEALLAAIGAAFD